MAQLLGSVFHLSTSRTVISRQEYLSEEGRTGEWLGLYSHTNKNLELKCIVGVTSFCFFLQESDCHLSTQSGCSVQNRIPQRVV